MPAPSPSEVLSFIASHEALERTLAQYPGLTRDRVRSLLRQAAVLFRAEEEGVPPASESLPLPDRAPRPEPRPVDAGVALRTQPPAQARPASTELHEPSGRTGPRRLCVFSDGASRGNPGPAGAGAVVLRSDGAVVAKCGKFLGVRTNNFAEYTGVIIGLETALRLGADEVELCSDSELLVRQLQGRYKVKHESLKPLHGKVKELLGRFAKVSVQHVPREQNKLADEMSNRAIDEKM
jgi:ribonuclease HI